jgi:hypothetical protein
MKSRRRFQRGLNDIGDDASVPLIQRKRSWHRDIETNRWAVDNATCGPQGGCSDVFSRSSACADAPVWKLANFVMMPLCR